MVSHPEQYHDVLQRIMKVELAGVLRYTHYAVMVRGPNRLPIVQFFDSQATESLAHARTAGEILTGLDGHPTLSINVDEDLEETGQHKIADLIRESHAHEHTAIELYKELLEIAAKRESVYLEEYARGQIESEERHSLELNKMMRDYNEDEVVMTTPAHVVASAAAASSLTSKL